MYQHYIWGLEQCPLQRGYCPVLCMNSQLTMKQQMQAKKRHIAPISEGSTNIQGTIALQVQSGGKKETCTYHGEGESGEREVGWNYQSQQSGKCTLSITLVQNMQVYVGDNLSKKVAVSYIRANVVLKLRQKIGFGRVQRSNSQDRSLFCLRSLFCITYR